MSNNNEAQAPAVVNNAGITSHTTTISTKPLIEKYQNVKASISLRDMILYFQQLEDAANIYERVEKDNYHPVAGRYFRVWEQDERNVSWLNKGKKEAIGMVLKSLKERFGREEQVMIEQAAGELRKELFEVENERETLARIQKIVSKEVSTSNLI